MKTHLVLEEMVGNSIYYVEDHSYLLLCSPQLLGLRKGQKTSSMQQCSKSTSRLKHKGSVSSLIINLSYQS